MRHTCTTCGTATFFERRQRTLLERFQTLHSMSRPHDCSERGANTMIKVFYRETKDILFEAMVIISGLALFFLLAGLLVNLTSH